MQGDYPRIVRGTPDARFVWIEDKERLGGVYRVADGALRATPLAYSEPNAQGPVWVHFADGRLARLRDDAEDTGDCAEQASLAEIAESAMHASMDLAEVRPRERGPRRFRFTLIRLNVLVALVARRYRSPLRAAQVEQTRASLLEAAATLLEERGIDALTLPEVARRAEVSPPTCYRYFPTLDDLLRALLDWLRPRIGMTHERLLGQAPHTLPSLPLDNFPRFEEHSAILKAVMDSPTWTRIRVESTQDRAAKGARVLDGIRADASAREQRLAAAAIYLLASPSSWRWLRETWGLDPDEAKEAASRGMAALVDAFKCGEGEGEPSAEQRRSGPRQGRNRSRPSSKKEKKR